MMVDIAFFASQKLVRGRSSRSSFTIVPEQRFAKAYRYTIGLSIQKHPAGSPATI